LLDSWLCARRLLSLVAAFKPLALLPIVLREYETLFKRCCCEMQRQQET